MRGLTLSVGLLLLAGCSPGGKVEDFTPPADNARKALEAALNHWKAGNPPGTVSGTSPAVEVLDSKWKAGQKITGYEVLGEDAAGPGPRTFKVRLTLARGSPVEVRYVVVGIDPLWVYRDEDYKKLSGAGM
ncbi:MAG TPA: hypothetical protein VFG68_20100 [Fimbriiglobus sp.]|nr:hypothetical protein [Fimbriiglobus sp.]